MQGLEVSCAVRLIYTTLGAKGLNTMAPGNVMATKTVNLFQNNTLNLLQYFIIHYDLL